MSTIRFWLISLLLLPLPAGANLLTNPSFEVVDGDQPAAWRTHIWSGSAEFELSAQAHSGQHSVEVDSSRGGDASWSIVVPVRPFATYHLSA